MIESWLQQFNDYWVNHDIGGVMGLFAENVTYWETPFKQLRSIEEIRSEWAAIQNQFDIRLTTSVHATQDSHFTVKWSLFYTTKSHGEKHWAGIYLLELDETGKCTYFYQVGEPEIQR